MKEFPQKIAILGVGLIGGSIALGLKSHFGSKITVSGSCRNPLRTQKAVKEGIIDVAINNIDKLPKGTDLIIIAAPVRITLEMINKLARNSPTNCLIIDVGSTKKIIMETAEKMLPREVPFIGTHPMAGSEFSGFENADPNLFRNKPWIICTSRNTTAGALRTIKRLVAILGGRPLLMDAQKHDETASFASHLLLAASSLLVNTVAGQKNSGELLQIASTGFRDTTRLASDNVKMKTDIFLTNKANVLKSLAALQKELGNFINILSGGNEKKLYRYLIESKLQRDNWLSRHFS